MTKYFIAVAGNIGAGKSTLTSLLSQRLNWEPFLEGVSDNPYLVDFYDDMEKWSFHSQVFFMARRLRHHRQLLERLDSVIQDRTVYEDAEIFARNLYIQGSMSERDYATYNELYRAVTAILTSSRSRAFSSEESPSVFRASPIRTRMVPGRI